jgi:hypothetical protein
MAPGDSYVPTRPAFGRKRPKGASGPILPKDSIARASGHSIPLSQLNLSTEPLRKLMIHQSVSIARLHYFSD